MNRFRIATYNIHKCVGIDRKYSPERIAEVLNEIDADVIALQEVLCHSVAHHRRDHQAEFLAEELEMDFRLGENRLHKGGEYGNAVLSRLKIGDHKNHDITVKNYEPRGCLRTEIEIDSDRSIQLFNVHMGTSFLERRQQVHKLTAEHVLDAPMIGARRIVAGDFNEWTSGITTRLLKSRFKAVDAKTHLGRTRTFPGILPLVHLDHIYFDNEFSLVNAFVHRSKAALRASDHLPIVAEFEL